MKYIISGNPIPLARVRFNKNGRPWDSQKNIKLMWGVALNNQHDAEREAKLEGPLHLDANFFFPIPSSKWKMKNLYIGQAFTQKPDLDNLAKFLMDVCNGILYEDDCQVVSICCKKLYAADQVGRTEFELKELR